MKNKDFNKLGDTTLRTKQPVIDTITILDWIQSIKEEGNVQPESGWENAFVDFCKEQEIYCYRHGEAIKRFGLFKTVVVSKLNILDSNINFIDSIDEIDINYIFEKAQKNYKPFKKIIDFLAFKEKCDAKKLFLCFALCEEHETIGEIYNLSRKEIFQKICEKSILKNFVDFSNPSLEECENFLSTRKPIAIKTTIKKIIVKKLNQQLVNYEDFNEYDSSKDKHLKRIFGCFTANPTISFMIQKINSWSLQLLLRNLRISIDDNTLFGSGDYFTLFVYWMHDFRLSLKTGKNTDFFISNNMYFDQIKHCYQIGKKPPEINYPYSFDEVKKFLSKISSNDYSFKADENYYELNSVPNAALAEYFTNLFYCYQFNIATTEFKKYVNTKVSDSLIPIFTAPGGVPDMWYIKEGKAITIETTIHPTENLIRNNEFFPCLNHLEKIVKELNASKGQLILVSKLDEMQLPNLSYSFKTIYDGLKQNKPLFYSKFLMPKLLTFNTIEKEII